jgi:hypothetical protein
VLNVDAVPLGDGDGDGDGDHATGQLVRTAEVDVLGGALHQPAPAVSDTRNRRRTWNSAHGMSSSRSNASRHARSRGWEESKNSREDALAVQLRLGVEAHRCVLQAQHLTGDEDL